MVDGNDIHISLLQLFVQEFILVDGGVHIIHNPLCTSLDIIIVETLVILGASGILSLLLPHIINTRGVDGKDIGNQDTEGVSVPVLVDSIAPADLLVQSILLAPERKGEDITLLSTVLIPANIDIDVFIIIFLISQSPDVSPEIGEDGLRLPARIIIQIVF